MGLDPVAKKRFWQDQFPRGRSRDPKLGKEAGSREQSRPDNIERSDQSGGCEAESVQQCFRSAEIGRLDALFRHGNGNAASNQFWMRQRSTAGAVPLNHGLRRCREDAGISWNRWFCGRRIQGLVKLLHVEMDAWSPLRRSQAISRSKTHPKSNFFTSEGSHINSGHKTEGWATGVN